MAPTLPFSLSPHICIQTSADLRELLENASLPPLPRILQSFTPLSQVTTRTTTLTSVPHASFALRFSELQAVESLVHEDEEQRAGRTMDWIGSRVASKSVQWIDMVESAASREDSPFKTRTPWWDEVKRCVEGDSVPNRAEGWNHPVAIVCAVSTLAANPLQALQDMHSRPVDFPPWVDGTHMLYSLIVHPSNSPLSDSIAESLFNAVKKQYGLHTYLLQLTLPDSPPQQPPRMPSPMPNLPPLSSMELSPIPSSQVPSRIVNPLSRPTTPGTHTPGVSTLGVNLPSSQRATPVGSPRPANTLALNDNDIQQFGRFVREFVVMSLVPWMEKCVLEWNESYSSSRRLPSRLFSSTRRLFGTGYSTSSPATPPTGHGSNTSVSSVTSRFTGHAPNNSVSSIASVTSLGTGAMSQQRRLAEFATILGDYKLAITVWETLRKDSKGGSDILPLLVAPSPALALHASNSIAALHSIASEMPALAQMRALMYAVRWDIGIEQRDFISGVLDGDRWLVHASGAAEEPPTALLLGHAAFLSARKGARRRAALWYLRAGDRLEKAGIKPLALYFFRQAHQLYVFPSKNPKELSPSFWDSEGKDPTEWRGFEAVLPGIEHELGRLLYTTGDTAGAVRYFLGLLRESPPLRVAMPSGLGLTTGDALMDGKIPLPPTDRVYLEDFRVAVKHFRTTEASQWESVKDGLQLHMKLCHVKDSRLRLPGDAMVGEPEGWKQLEDEWERFWRPRGRERLEEGGKAAVNEPFWFDLVLRNSLNVEVSISRLSLIVRDSTSPDQPTPEFVEVEIIDDVVLGAKETRTIPIFIKCAQPASLIVTHATYEFLSLLPVMESLAIRGRRLHDTPQQRQNKVYAPDVLTTIEVEDAGLRLQAHFVDDRHLILAHGERKHMDVILQNTGSKPIKDLWLLTGRYDEVWIGGSEPGSSFNSHSSQEILHSSNSLTPRKPYQVPLLALPSSELAPGASLNLSVIIHAAHTSERDLALLLVFRDSAGQAFRSTRLTRRYEVRRILDISTTYEPSQSLSHPFLVNLIMENIMPSSGVRVSQVTTVSPSWSCTPISDYSTEQIAPRQMSRISFTTQPLQVAPEVEESRKFLQRQLKAVLAGDVVQFIDPPSVDLHCNHVCKSADISPLNDDVTRHFLHTGKVAVAARVAAGTHPHIPEHLHPSIFPLYNPASIDIVVFWEIPSQGRSGHLLLHGLVLGAIHAPLSELLEEAQNAKATSMYAETQRERVEILDAVRSSEWNAEMDPVVVSVPEGTIVRHNFSEGPCIVPIAFNMRNHSLTNSVQYKFRLSTVTVPRQASSTLPPKYVGRLTHKGQLVPSESTSVTAKLCVWHAGTYTLDSWSLIIDVLESSSSTDGSTQSQVRQTYEQVPQAGDSSSITIVDIAGSL